MKPLMMQQEAPQEPQQAPQDEPQGQELSDEAMDLVNGVKTVLFDDEFIPAFEQAMQGGADFASAAALLCFSLIEQGQKEMGMQFGNGMLYGRGGVADYVMTAIYAYGQGVGVPEAQDQNSYETAMQKVSQISQQAEGGE